MYIKSFNEYISGIEGNTDTNKLSVSPFLLSDYERYYLLELDKEYGNCIEEFRTKYVARTCDNLKEEFKKFKESYIDKKEKYFPQLIIKNSKVDNELLDRMKLLRNNFKSFDTCYVSKFYVEKLDSMIHSMEQRAQLEAGTYKPGNNPVSKKCLNDALQCVKEHPYKKVDYKNDRIHDAEYAKERVEDAMEDLGYGFDVKIVDNMLPRMNVKMGHLNINTSSKFSDEDVKGLIEHEVKGHVGRRYYGMKTGLWLFAYGLQSSSTYDEGLAVWNSLNNIKEEKPNIYFNIAMKTCVSYYMFEKDFCELFDWIKEQAPDMSDYTAFKTIIRPKRKIKDCKIKSGEPMTTYYRGWKLVDKMDDKQRDDLLKYNIGPDQIDELEKIKEFLEVNKFEPLK